MPGVGHAYPPPSGSGAAHIGAKVRVGRSDGRPPNGQAATSALNPERTGGSTVLRTPRRIAVCTAALSLDTILAVAALEGSSPRCVTHGSRH